jgi:hypothetical protein
MRNYIVRAGGLAGAAGAVLLLAGAGLAMASSAAHTSVTGPEVVSGAVHGKAAIANNTHIPLHLSGVVVSTDRSFVLSGGPSNAEHTLTTPVGKLTVKPKSQQHGTQTANAKTCRVTFTERQQFTFVASKSTGKFAGAAGPGAYQIRFAGYFPRFASGKHKGQCNFSNSAVPLTKGAVATFLAAGVITVG